MFKTDFNKKRKVANNFIGNMSTTDGCLEIEELFNGRRAFDYPKPTSLIKHILKISSQKDALILDFFAGSGTTGHAVLELNKEDGGSRKFILVTNNENNICRDVTYQRIKRVIEGYTTPKGKKVDGCPGSLNFYEAVFKEKLNENN